MLSWRFNSRLFLPQEVFQNIPLPTSPVTQLHPPQRFCSKRPCSYSCHLLLGSLLRISSSLSITRIVSHSRSELSPGHGTWYVLTKNAAHCMDPDLREPCRYTFIICLILVQRRKDSEQLCAKFSKKGPFSVSEACAKKRNNLLFSRMQDYSLLFIATSSRRLLEAYQNIDVLLCLNRLMHLGLTLKSSGPKWEMC